MSTHESLLTDQSTYSESGGAACKHTVEALPRPDQDGTPSQNEERRKP